VEVKTDYVPLVEFDRVITRFFVEASDDAEREVEFVSTPDLDSNAWGEGVRVAEVEQIPAGPVTVEVELRRGDEASASRRLQITATEAVAITVPLTRSCEGVVCDGGERSACLAGRCVTPECADGTGDCEFATLPLSDYPRAFVAATCARLRTCSAAAFDISFAGFDCVEVLGPSFDDTIAEQFLDALDRGTLTYDPRLARACIEAARSVSCDAPLLTFDLGECYDAFSPPEDVTDCHFDLECGRNRYCDTRAGCPGTCVPRDEVGQPCLDDATCGYGLSCRGPDAASQVCVPLAEAGDACGGEAGVCAADHFCLGLRPLRGEVGRCVPVEEAFSAREGEACNLFEGPYCALGLSCGRTAIETGICTRHPVASGGACSAGIPDMCPAGEYCLPSGVGVPEGTCVPLPREGEGCVFDIAVVRCAAGHRCVDEVCRVVGRLGDACASGDECVSRYCAGGVCTAPDCITHGSL
jgi:hypothetical protein